MRFILLSILPLFLSTTLLAAGGDAPHFDAENMGLQWIIPFAGILLSIAIFPLIAPHFWHENFGIISLFWAVMFLVPFFVVYGASVTLYEILHVGLLEYIPFIVLLFSLFTVAGGVRVVGKLKGTPLMNTAILALGTLLASWMGTTGAAMLLIRPILNANEGRKYVVHTCVFFIFLVANIGGALTPLGDPPLFLGFLKGVDFFWPTKHLLVPMIMVSTVLLILYFIIDTVLFRKEDKAALNINPDETRKIGLEGKVNLLLIGGIIGAVLLSGTWKPGIEFIIYHVPMPLQNIARDVALVGIGLLSLRLTVDESRKANGFSWFPILEVAKLFAGIFLTIIPAIAILKSGTDGALGQVINAVTNTDGTPNNMMYFWLTGILSSFLDNAPTYLVFFNTAGGDPNILMDELHMTLLAISAAAVFMGANSYIGNAPNFMVKAIAEERGVKMPSFFGYMIWSGIILIPIYIVLSWIYF